MYTVGILTVSDKGFTGERIDTSGDAIQAFLEEKGFSVIKRGVVPDEIQKIRDILKEWISEEINLIFTTGGTGLAPRDVTPQAMEALFDYEVPGIPEAMRAYGLKFTPHAMLSRARAGVKGRTLIINLPGSKRGALEGLEAIFSALPHALSKLLGDPTDCGI